MKLYLTRHGDALTAFNDSERPLSPLGLKQVNTVGAVLNQRGIVVDYIYHSGILRARQTAELLAPQIQARHIEALSGLRPEDPVDLVLAAVTTWTQSTLLVGHLPYMGYLLTALTQQAASVMFETATIVCLAPAGQAWAVQWVLTPDA